MKLLTLLICSTMALSTAWADKDPGQQDQPPSKEQRKDQDKDQDRWQDGDQDQDKGRWQDGDQDQDDGYDRPPVPQDPVFLLNGTWELIQQTCSSGAPVRSGFVFGRDFLELTFTDFDFTARSEIARCSSWSSGDYDMNQNVLRLTVNRARSTCGPGDPLITFSYPIRVYNNSQFGISMGPLNGGPCPQGDILENIYERAY